MFNLQPKAETDLFICLILPDQQSKTQRLAGNSKHSVHICKAKPGTCVYLKQKYHKYIFFISYCSKMHLCLIHKVNNLISAVQAR